MAVHIGSFIVPGTNSPPRCEPPALQTTRFKYNGVRGESEITGDLGGRRITIDMVIHDGRFTTPTSVYNFLDNMADRGGFNGYLRVDHASGIKDGFPNCTFEGFVSDRNVLCDVAGTLNGGQRNRWWCTATLIFYQLSV